MYDCKCDAVCPFDFALLKNACDMLGLVSTSFVFKGFGVLERVGKDVSE